MALDLVSRERRLSLYPQVKQEFVDSREEDMIVLETPQKLTNFSISEILKPNFGLRTVKIENNFCSDVKIAEAKSYPRDRTSCSSPDSTGSLSPSSKENTTPTSSPGEGDANLWPAWVYCTRYSDRPSSGPRSRKIRKKSTKDDKRPRTAFSNEQLDRLQVEFESCRYLTETRRKDLSNELNLSETQIKIWFQNKRAKLKKGGSSSNTLALHLMAQGLYDHSTVSVREETEGH